MERHGGNLHAYFKVKEASSEEGCKLCNPTTRRPGKGKNYGDVKEMNSFPRLREGEGRRKRQRRKVFRTVSASCIRPVTASCMMLQWQTCHCTIAPKSREYIPSRVTVTWREGLWTSRGKERGGGIRETGLCHIHHHESNRQLVCRLLRKAGSPARRPDDLEGGMGAGWEGGSPGRARTSVHRHIERYMQIQL